MKTMPRILVVEDSETQALQLRFLLEAEGWDVTHAPSAEAALDCLNGRLPGLMVVDFHLPGMNGGELCRRVRMNVATRGIPIVMLTADEGFGGEQAGLDSGADGYVAKSAATSILVLRVRALLRGANSPSRESRESEPRFQRARILAIDDSPTYLERLAGELTDDGYEVIRTNGGREGIERAGQEPFDCVMVDLVMPEVDGIEVCRRITEMAHESGQSVIVIMLTARETHEDMTRGLEAGADDFVGKSSDMAVLKARIRALLRRRFVQEENRRIQEQLLRREMEANEARAAQALAETRAALVEELERKNSELEAFSYSVSHDLRAPLRSLDGFSNALLEECGDVLSERGKGYLRRVRAAAQRMGELIDDLLQLSRVGRAELRPGHVDISTLVRTVASELQHGEPGRPVRVLIEEGLAAEADRGLLRVVLENLIGNAWKFTSARSDTVIEFGASHRDGAVVYFIRDNGAGFDMEYASKLFAPFQRLHTTAEFPGTGIGLATVRRIVERHGGRIWAESAVNQGAAFFWTLGSPA